MNRLLTRVTAAATLAIVGIAVTACGPEPTAQGGDSTTLTVQGVIPGAGWDPYKNDFGNAAPAEQASYASLMKMNNDGTVAPGLAE